MSKSQFPRVQSDAFKCFALSNQQPKVQSYSVYDYMASKKYSPDFTVFKFDCFTTLNLSEIDHCINGSILTWN